MVRADRSGEKRPSEKGVRPASAADRRCAVASYHWECRGIPQVRGRSTNSARVLSRGALAEGEEPKSKPLCLNFNSLQTTPLVVDVAWRILHLVRRSPSASRAGGPAPDGRPAFDPDREEGGDITVVVRDGRY